jgi:hypothetical protein
MAIVGVADIHPHGQARQYVDRSGVIIGTAKPAGKPLPPQQRESPEGRLPALSGKL